MQNKPGQSIKNFGRNVEFTPQARFQPESVEEILEIFRNHKGKRIRAAGKLHSWSEAVVADEVYLDLKKLNSVDVKQKNGASFVTVGAGCQIKQLLVQLEIHGLTLPSIGLIDEQSVAGATATGTHGSGKHSLSHYVESVQIIHYDKVSGDPQISTVDVGQDLRSARCSLGLLGIIVALKFKCRPIYRIKEHVEKHATLKKVLDAEKRYPLQQFYLMPWSWSYFGHHRVESNEPRSKSAFWYQVYWFLFIDLGLHLAVCSLSKFFRFNGLVRFFYKRVLPLTLARNWKVVDDSTRLLTMQHELFRHIEIELFVTRSSLANAIEFVIDAVSVFGGQPTVSGNLQSENLLKPFAGSYCHHYPICVRRILPDDTLISMSSPDKINSNNDWYSISFISYERPKQRTGFFGFADFLATAMAARFQARPHWGKYNPLSGTEISGLYPNLEEFRLIKKRFDPDSRFQNDWLTKVIDD